MEIESAIASDDGKRQYNSLAQQLLYVMRGAQ
jgi:hypothetical protein